MHRVLEKNRDYVLWCYGRASGCKVVEYGMWKGKRSWRCLTHNFIWHDYKPKTKEESIN